MLRSRSIVNTLVKGHSASSILSSQRNASLHTARALAEEKRGFLSRLNPFAKPTTEEPKQTPEQAAKALEELHVQIEDEEQDSTIPSWKGERLSLTPQQWEESVRSAAAPFVDTASTIQLHKITLDPKIKFKVLKAAVVSTGQEIPSTDIAKINSLKDLVSTLKRLDRESRGLSKNPKGHVVAEWFENNKTSLPPNMVFIPYKKSVGIKVEDRKRTNKRFL